MIGQTGFFVKSGPEGDHDDASQTPRFRNNDWPFSARSLQCHHQCARRVLVGHTTVIEDEPHVACTGVTIIIPSEDKIRVEEAILNALTAAETMTGFKGHIAHELPRDELKRIMARFGRVGEYEADSPEVFIRLDGGLP